MHSAALTALVCGVFCDLATCHTTAGRILRLPEPSIFALFLAKHPLLQGPRVKRGRGVLLVRRGGGFRSRLLYIDTGPVSSEACEGTALVIMFSTLDGTGTGLLGDDALSADTHFVDHDHQHRRSRAHDLTFAN